jgi:hypothetical protein
MVRRMEAGTAPFGTRWGVSIDPDDYALQLVHTGDDGEEVLILASGRGGFLPRVTAAAGDPDEEPDESAILFEMASDEMLERYTRLRIRGLTACAVPAFTGAYMELDGGGDGGGDEAEDEVVTASAAAPVAPPMSWFNEPEPELGDERLIEQFDLATGESIGFAVPLTITDDGQVFGHLACNGTCHTGYLGQCVTAPPSPSGYVDFHVGAVVTAEGSTVAAGALVVGTDHAAAHLMAPEARDHYANTGLAWADVRIVDGQWGPWCRGALRPGLSDEVVRVLRASALSGDWRQRGGHLELQAALSVNSPGFPIAREALAAAASAGVTLVAAGTPTIHIGDAGQVQTLVAAGVVNRCPECAERARMATQLGTIQAPAEVMELLRTLEYRTRHLVPAGRDHALARIRGPINREGVTVGG